MIIIVAGLPGTGKTYFATRLSRKLNACYISSDQMREIMDIRGQYPFEDRLDVYEEMANHAGTLLRQSMTVVVDATFFKRPMRELFLTLAKLLHKEVRFIEIVADEATIRARLSRPEFDGAADFSVYRQVKLQWEPLEVAHLEIESDENNPDAMLEKGMNYINNC